MYKVEFTDEELQQMKETDEIVFPNDEHVKLGKSTTQSLGGNNSRRY